MLMYSITKYCGLFILLLGCCLCQPEADRRKVVIVGAGVSGLSAANHLCKNGICDITILEAEVRVGGRLYTDQFQGELIERGAQWMHGITDNPVYRLISKDHLVMKENWEQGTIKLSSGDTADARVTQLLTAAEELWDDLNEQLLAMEDSSSQNNVILLDAARTLWNEKLGSRNITLDKNITDAIFKYTMVQWSMEDGERAQNVSVLAYLYYRYLEGGDVIVPEGYSVLLDILHKGVPKCAIKLGREVTKIVWNDTNIAEMAETNTVMLEYTDRCGSIRRLYADHVIVTVSIGVLQKVHRSMFVPNLPKQKSIALETLRLGIVNKIFLQYDNKFWNDEDFPMNILWNSKIENEFKEDAHWYREISRVREYRENILLIWANAYVSREVLDLPNEEIGRKITILLRRFMGNKSIPYPDDVLVTRWHKNEHFLGSYSYTAPGETKATKEIVIEPLTVNGVPKVLFAGEATHLDRFGTIDGAYQTGEREANRIIGLNV